MEGGAGFIKLYRSLHNHWVNSRLDWKAAWVDILLITDYKTGEVCLTDVPAKEHFSDSSWRHFITLLVEDRMLEDVKSVRLGKGKGSKQYAIVSNWFAYHSGERSENNGPSSDGLNDGLSAGSTTVQTTPYNESPTGERDSQRQSMRGPSDGLNDSLNDGQYKEFQEVQEVKKNPPPTPRLTPRQRGDNPRARGENPRALGTNPRATGSNPRQSEADPYQLAQRLQGEGWKAFNLAKSKPETEALACWLVEQDQHAWESLAVLRSIARPTQPQFLQWLGELDTHLTRFGLPAVARALRGAALETNGSNPWAYYSRLLTSERKLDEQTGGSGDLVADFHREQASRRGMTVDQYKREILGQYA